MVNNEEGKANKESAESKENKENKKDKKNKRSKTVRRSKGSTNNPLLRKSVPLIVAASMAFGSGTTVTTQNLLTADGQDNAIAEKKDYTVLVYMIGSDLESDPDAVDYEGAGAATNDMKEIAAAMAEFGLDDSVHVVAQIGGSESWKEKSLADIENARLTIDSEGIHVIEKLSDTDMGKSKTVTDFIDYACEAYPAEEYIMVFWNHGNGPTSGYGYDVLHDGSSLTLGELQQAFEAADYQEFELIGFDACCMGNIETVNALRGYTKYMVASPACEDINGWDYRWMEILSEEEASGKKIGWKIVDTFADFYQTPDHQSKVATLSCYDMSAYEKLWNMIQAYNRELLMSADEDGSVYENLSRLRSGIAGYYSGELLHETMELLDFKQLFTSLNAARWESYGMTMALKAFVCRSTGISGDMCGISIYLPGKNGMELAEEMFLYITCGFEENYLKFVYNYAKILDDELEINLEEIRTKYDEETRQIQFQIAPGLLDQIATAYILTAYQSEDDGEYYLLSTDSDVIIGENGILTGILDIKYFTIADQILCLIEKYNSDARTQYLSPIWYHDKICLMTIEVSLDDPDGKIVSIVPYDQNQRAEKEQYTLQEGESFCALYPIVNENGETDLDAFLEKKFYHRGEMVWLKDYDCDLELQDVAFEDCFYGLMIQDKTMALHYSSLSRLD